MNHTKTSFLEQGLAILACIGLFLVSHIWFQSINDFAAGCTGLADLTENRDSGCRKIHDHASSSILGISNIWLGILFYVFMLLLAFTSLMCQSSAIFSLLGLRVLVSTGGIYYAIYLIYLQAFVIGAFCGLCLANSAVVGAIWLLSTLSLASKARSRKEYQESGFKRPPFLCTNAVIFTALLIMANAIHSRIIFPDIAGAELERSDCGFDARFQPIHDFQALIQPADPSIGNPASPWTIVIYLDPNCPPCRAVHEDWKNLIDNYSDKVRFVYKVIPLKPESHGQVLALELAREQGLFFQMLDYQFARQQTGAMTGRELMDAALKIGMKVDVLTSSEDRTDILQMIAERSQQATGNSIFSTPTVLLNGHLIAPSSRRADCMQYILDRLADSGM